MIIALRCGAADVEDTGMGIIIDNGNRPEIRPSACEPRPRTDGLRVMTLNVWGGGDGNKPYESHGMDPGDVDELARRIANHDVDVATLQEVWEMDIPELERQLEHITGDEWDLYFSQASSKARYDDDFMGTIYTNQPFGNVVAVRLGDGVASSEFVGEQKLDAPGDDGSDGRTAISVRVHTDDGATVDIVTTHTDPRSFADEATRAQQIEDVRQFAEDHAEGRPVIITGDFNASIESDNPPGSALQEYVEDGYTDAGDIGATSDFGRGSRIDFIFTSSEIEAGDPARVQGHSPDVEGEDRDLSDHDGVVVDVEVPISDEGVGSGGGGGGSSGSW